MIRAYLKKSIIAKILVTVAAILILTDIGLLALGYSSVHTAPGTVVPYSLTEAEACASNGGETKKVEGTDNEYGHVMTAYSAIYDSDGNVTALVGADVSLDEALQIFYQRYRMMFVAVMVSFVFVLSILAIILKIRVLKPAEPISRQMKEFADNRQPEFGKIEIKGSDEFAQMADTFNYMTEEIDNYIKNINRLTEEKHRREAEISIAGKIQRGLLPDFHINVEASLENFDTIQEFILADGRIPSSLKKKLCLAAEEIFVNICSYAYGEGKGNVEVTMEISGQIVMTFRDSGKRFNPLENMADVSDYDIDSQIGGLGRQIAFKLADEARYEYSNGKNILTLIFCGGNKFESHFQTTY